MLTPHVSGNMTLGYTCDKNVELFCEDLEQLRRRTSAGAVSWTAAWAIEPVIRTEKEDARDAPCVLFFCFYSRCASHTNAQPSRKKNVRMAETYSQKRFAPSRG